MYDQTLDLWKYILKSYDSWRHLFFISFISYNLRYPFPFPCFDDTYILQLFDAPGSPIILFHGQHGELCTFKMLKSAHLKYVLGDRLSPIGVHYFIYQSLTNQFQSEVNSGEIPPGKKYRHLPSPR